MRRKTERKYCDAQKLLLSLWSKKSVMKRPDRVNGIIDYGCITGFQMACFNKD